MIRLTRACRIGIIVAVIGLLAMGFGILRGEMSVVFEKAVNICMECEGDLVTLWIEDNGEGIAQCDIRRVFEKGFTGRNYHNGKYKSTGMGLYLAAQIAKRLELYFNWL